MNRQYLLELPLLLIERTLIDFSKSQTQELFAMGPGNWAGCIMKSMPSMLRNAGPLNLAENQPRTRPRLPITVLSRKYSNRSATYPPRIKSMNRRVCLEGRLDFSCKIHCVPTYIQGPGSAELGVPKLALGNKSFIPGLCLEAVSSKLTSRRDGPKKSKVGLPKRHFQSSEFIRRESPKLKTVLVL